ncbi:MAG: hypothetical protein WC819_04280 [Parcubacteria group bacterium]|jgi:hypothetical protein
MSVTGTKKENDKTTFTIQDLEHFGTPDPEPREIVVMHDKLCELPKITKGEMDVKAKYSPNTIQWKFYDIAGQKIVFELSYDDTDFCSTGFRASAHSTSCPYLLTK